jgi:hypothetical protein
MKILLLVLMFLSSFSALAQTKRSDSAVRNELRAQTLAAKYADPPTRFEIYPLNYRARFERNPEQALQAHAGFGNFALGFARGRMSTLLEISSYTADSAAGNIKISREHREALLWLRRNLGRTSWLRFQGGIGLGSSQESVTTSMDDESVRDVGRWDALGAASLGAAIDIQKTLRLSLEGRLFFGPNMDPNPQPDVVLRTGFLF